MLSFMSLLGLLVAQMCIIQIYGAEPVFPPGITKEACQWQSEPSFYITQAVISFDENSLVTGTYGNNNYAYQYSNTKPCSKEYSLPVSIPLGSGLISETTAVGIMMAIPANRYLKFTITNSNDEAITIPGGLSIPKNICNTEADDCTATEAVTNAAVITQPPGLTGFENYLWRGCSTSLSESNTLYTWFQLFDTPTRVWDNGLTISFETGKVYSNFAANSDGPNILAAACPTAPSCDKGSYGVLGGSPCTSCGTGYTTTGSGTSGTTPAACDTCADGYSGSTSNGTSGCIKIVKCDKGSYGEGGNFPCTSCGTGYTTTGSGTSGTTPAACDTCADGYNGSTSNGTSGCIKIVECDKGSYGEGGNSPCTSCGTGYTTTGSGTSGTTPAACDTCADGYNGSTSNGTSGCTEIVECDKGSYGEGGNSPCTSCGTGYTTTGSGTSGTTSAACDTCADGYSGSTSNGTSGCTISGGGDSGGGGLAPGCTIVGNITTCIDGKCITTTSPGSYSKVCTEDEVITTKKSNEGGGSGGAIGGSIAAISVLSVIGYYFKVYLPKIEATKLAAENADISKGNVESGAASSGTVNPMSNPMSNPTTMTTPV